MAIIPKKVNPIYIQEYRKGCNPKRLVGTKNYPAYLVGYATKPNKFGIYTAYYYGDGSYYNQIYTTDFLFENNHIENINISLWNIYIVNTKKPLAIDEIKPVPPLKNHQSWRGGFLYQQDWCLVFT